MQFNPCEIISQLEEASKLLLSAKEAMEAILVDNQRLEAEIESLKATTYYDDFNEHF